VDDLRDAVAFHQLLLNSNGASQATQKQYLGYECMFLDWLSSKRIAPKLSELNPKRVSEFLISYRSRPHPRRTRGGEVAVRAAADILKRLGSVLEEQEILDDNPMRRLKRPRITKFARLPFSEQELSAMWGACFRTQHPARDEALFLLLWNTGMRIGEACGLRMDKLDLTLRQATVLGKGRRERIVPISAVNEDGTPKRDGTLVRALKRWLDLRPEGIGSANEYVFLSRDRKRLTAPGGGDIINRVAALAGVDDAYPHRLRHTYCTWYLTVFPGDEIGLRRIVGHISKEVLADYVHLSHAAIAQRA